jgi:hypothetical protein
MIEDNRRTDIALAEYKEVVAQFRALTDIRFKLLTYLPLGTVAGAVFVSNGSQLIDQPAVAAFALVATVCIATYNKRNDQHYDELVSRAAELEREDLRLNHGSFSYRPQSWLRYGRVPVEHRWPIGLLYASASALWASVLAAAITRRVSVTGAPVWPQVLAAAVVIACWRLLRWLESMRAQDLRNAVKSLVNQLVPQGPMTLDDAQRSLIKATTKYEPLFRVDEEKAKRRVFYHWAAYQEKRDLLAAGRLLGAVIDLPARWIEDIASGRR